MTWRPTRRTDAFDLALAALLLAGGYLSLYIGTDESLTGELADYPRVAGVLALTGVVAPLAVRRRAPSVVLAATTVAYVPFTLLQLPEYTVASVAYFVALYSAGAYGGRRRNLARVAGAAIILALVVWVLADGQHDYPGDISLTLVNVFTAGANVFYLAGAWVLGDLVRARRQREVTLVAQAETLHAMQAERSRQAVRDEQVRIARELHDVVAHHVSVMGVQAGAARHVLGDRPAAVPGLLAQIEESSRQAVAELARMLALLRRDDEAGGTDPQPTLARIDALAEQMRDAGLAVTTDVSGTTAGLPAGVELSAYRIVQEALTNSLKHAGPGTAAAVRVIRRAGSLEVVVTDEGRARDGTGTLGSNGNSDGNGNGLGLVGMRERVALHGGELKAGRHAGGGFEVRAWLPLGRPARDGAPDGGTT